jgi:glucokinase
MKVNEVAVGIDIGGTFTKFGLINRAGQVLWKDSIPTEANKPAELLFDRIFAALNKYFSKSPEKYQVRGVGIGAPNANHYTGRIENPPNLSWKSVDLIELVHRHEAQLLVEVTNDANAAALGEMIFGNARNVKDFILLTLGTGLGSGIIANGALIYGHDGFAGEMGHLTVVRDGRPCGCGRRGCLETYVSAPGIVRTVRELLTVSEKESILRDIPTEKMESVDIYKAALAGDAIALEAFEITSRILGETLADAVAYLSPEAIFLSGGLAEAGDFIFKPAKEHMEKNLLPVFQNKVKILPSGLPQGEVALLGAAALIWHELN